MNVPGANKTREGIAGGLCAGRAVLTVFFNPCLAAVLRDGKDGRANQTQDLPSPNDQRAVPIADEVGA